MNQKVDSDRTAIQLITEEGKKSALRSLEQYVANRRKTFALFDRLDPTSKQAQDAKALLGKAIGDHAAYTALINGTESAQSGCGRRKDQC